LPCICTIDPGPDQQRNKARVIENLLLDSLQSIRAWFKPGGLGVDGSKPGHQRVKMAKGPHRQLAILATVHPKLPFERLASYNLLFGKELQIRLEMPNCRRETGISLKNRLFVPYSVKPRGPKEIQYNIDVT